MFLVNYSSSSESDDENSKNPYGKELIQNPQDVQSNGKLLPQASSLLGKRKQDAIDEGVNDDPLQHDGRIRSFKHERGNWATYVYIPGNNSSLEDMQDICLLHLREKIILNSSTEMHISLSKTVVLQYHFIESFVESIQKATRNLESFTVSFDSLKVYTNTEHTRTFVALKISDLYFEKMLNILQKVDSVLKEFKLATFYENPSFHISVVWCTGDRVSLIETLLPTILESLKDRLPFNFKIDQICCKSGFKEFSFMLK